MITVIQGVVGECRACGRGFTVEQLLGDPHVAPLGLLLDAYLFDHRCGSTGTLLSVPVTAFDEVIANRPIAGSGPMLAPLGEGCEGRCVDLDDHDECGRPCVHARYRRFLVDVLIRRTSKGARWYIG